MAEIGGYQLLRRLGSGGMGTVHEALDADGRHVAIKVLHPAISADPMARQRLRREVEVLHRVRDAGVARVLDAEADGVDAFIVTELVDGPTLDEQVRSHGPLPEDELAALGQGLAEGLGAIHDTGITHRDLKPGNVMISERGPVIIDFGIAQVADDARLTQTGLVTGTPGYLAPEVLEGSSPAPEADWWAWAAVLVFAATGHPPFGTGPSAAVLARVSAGHVDTSGLSAEWARALQAALAPQPAQRLGPEKVLAILTGEVSAETLLGPGATNTEPATRVLPPVATGAGRPATTAPPSEPATPLSQAPDEPRFQEADTYPTPGEPHGYAPSPSQSGYGAMAAELPHWARGLPARSGTVAALGLALSGWAALAPGAWVLFFAVLVVALGTAGHGWHRLRETRLRRGVRRTDAARTVLAAPWYLVWAGLLALPGLVVGGLLGGGVWWVGTTLQPALEEHWVLWAAALLICLTCWVMPSSLAARNGARYLLRPVGPGLQAAIVATALIVAGLWALLLYVGVVGPVSWWPLAVRPAV